MAVEPVHIAQGNYEDDEDVLLTRKWWVSQHLVLQNLPAVHQGFLWSYTSIQVSVFEGLAIPFFDPRMRCWRGVQSLHEKTHECARTPARTHTYDCIVYDNAYLITSRCLPHSFVFQHSAFLF